MLIAVGKKTLLSQMIGVEVSFSSMATFQWMFFCSLLLVDGVVILDTPFAPGLTIGANSLVFSSNDSESDSPGTEDSRVQEGQ